MGRTTPRRAADVAPHDVEVDLGGGYSTVYREGERIRPEHQGKPTKRANLPKSPPEVDEQQRGDLAPDRLGGTIVG